MTISSASAFALAVLFLPLVVASSSEADQKDKPFFFSFVGSDKNRTFGSEFALYGDAELSDSAVRLTRPANASTGRVVYREPVRFYGTNPGFSSSFSFALSPGHGGGLTFFLSPSGVMPEPVNGHWSRVSTSLVAVRFETAKADKITNLTGTLIEIDVESSNLSGNNLMLDLDSGSKFNSWIDYDGESKRIEVRLSHVAPNSKEEKPDFPEKSARASATDSRALALSAVNDGHRPSSSASKGARRAAPLKTDDHPTSSQSQHQAPRKLRRCWSPDLHRRFISALKQLGGAQVATPKQIRELMKVEGLTNDEVKSHLQKYRLHAKKVSTSDSENQPIPISGGVPVAEEQHSSSSQPIVSQSDSPQSPLQLARSNAAGNSLEEDGKSESYNWN